MKRKISVSIVLLLVLLVTGVYFVNAGTGEKKVDVMFLHDTHSHLNEFATVEDGKSQILVGLQG